MKEIDQTLTNFATVQRAANAPDDVSSTCFARDNRPGTFLDNNRQNDRLIIDGMLGSYGYADVL